MRIFLYFIAVIILAGTANARLGDDVFRQADKLIVKPETYNPVVKNQAAFKIFLQNNMDRGIADISLQAESSEFNFDIKPMIISIPKGQRAFFQVTIKARQTARAGNHPVTFRLVGDGKVLKTFMMQAEAARPDGKAGSQPAEASSTSHTARAVSSEAILKALKASAISAAPVVDGELDDQCWKTAAALSKFSSSKGARAAFDTAGRLAFDRRNLYFGFSCNGENTETLTNDDYLEISLSFSPSDAPVYIFRISAMGKAIMKKQRLGSGMTSNWLGTNIHFALGRENRNWTAEFMIPFAALEEEPPSVSRKIFLRVVRMKTSGASEQSYWAAGADGYNVEKGFGEILLAP